MFDLTGWNVVYVGWDSFDSSALSTWAQLDVDTANAIVNYWFDFYSSVSPLLAIAFPLLLVSYFMKFFLSPSLLTGSDDLDE